MKNHILAIALLLFVWQLAVAKPKFIPDNKYIIGCLQTDGIGVVGLGGAGPTGVNYPLSFYPDRDGDSAIESDYWLITEQSPGKYSFKNAATLQYIKYDATAPVERTALVLVDQLQPDNSTLFTMELKQNGNLCYYLIRSVVNSAKGWNKRGLVDGFYPVGSFTLTGATNENFIFYTASGTSVTDDGQTPVVLPTAAPDLGAFKANLNSLAFSSKVPAVDLIKKQFYLTIPENQMGSNVTLNVSYTLKNPTTDKLYIADSWVESGTDYTFKTVVAGKTYKIEIKNGTTVINSGTIIFSSLPLVQIYSDASIQYVYTLGRIVVTEPEINYPSEILLSELRYRGATAAGQPKKAYAIKLKSPMDGTSSIDRSFFGLRTDNNWILDAMYIDPGRMRNRVSTDLWNDFSTPPYFKVNEPNLVNGTRGSFVEVFLNDSYNGLYCMTEKIDRKQLNVKKLKTDPITNVVTQRGGMYKGSDWSVGTLLGNQNFESRNGILTPIPAYNNSSETWSGFEVKYPDFGDGEPINWSPLVNAVTISSNSTPNITFDSEVGTYYDLPVFLDYYLFIELMLATDNHGKNCYLSVYDQTVSPKMTVTPWDLDGTWGRRWDGSSNLTYANQSFSVFINHNEWLENNLSIRMRNLDVDGYSTKLKNRYRELRGTYFAYNKIMERFNNYRAKFKISGADTREMAKWGIGNLDDEINFLSTWIKARLAYLDNQYLGGPYVTATGSIMANDLQVYPTLVHNKVTITTTLVGEKIQITSLQGILMSQFKSNGNDVEVDMSTYAPGVYVVKAGQYSTKIMKINK